MRKTVSAIVGLTTALLLSLTPAFGRSVGDAPEKGEAAATGTERTETEADGIIESVSEESESESEAEAELYSDVLIEEYDPESGENVSGARMEVLTADGKISLYEFDLLEDGHLLKGIKSGEYLLREISPAEGREPAQERKFSADGSKKETTVSVPSRKSKGRLIVSAVDENGVPLKGAELEIADSEGSAVDRFETTEEPKSFRVSEGGYVIRTIKAPDGRRKPKDVEVSVKAGDEETTGTVRFRPSSIFLTVSTKDGTPSNKSGGRILNAEGNAVAEWESGGGTGELLGLKAGSYVWEIVPEPGYATPESVPIEIEGNEDGKEFKAVLKKISAEISFVDSETGEPIEGAEITMKDDRGIERDVWTTDGEPHGVEGIPTGSYMLEAKVPPEYSTPAKFFIDVKDSERKQKATAKASLTQTIFRRIDEDGNLVGGCGIEVFSEETGESVVSFATESDAAVRIKGIPAGKYRAEETSTPKGFGKAASDLFEVSSDGGPIEVIMTDEEKEDPIEFESEEETGESKPERDYGNDVKGVVIGFLAATAALISALALTQIEKKKKKKK